MNISGLSDRGLFALWEAVQKAFQADEKSLMLGQVPEYGVRTFKDWKEWSDRLEDEMQKRTVPFEPIPWMNK